jgi:hypothetical protein
MNEAQSKKPNKAKQAQGSTPQTDSQNEKDLDLVKTLLSSYDPSHIHKENIAYAAFTLQFAIFASISTAEQWPPCWLTHYCHGVVVLVIVFIWLLIHMFVGWQLMNRRSHAKVINAATKYLWGSIGESDKNDDSETNQPNKLRNKICNKIKYLYAILIWWCKFAPSDEKIKKPCILGSFVEGQKRPGTMCEEMILWFLSVVMLALILFRTCND